MSELISKRFIQDALIARISSLNAEGTTQTAREELIRFKWFVDRLTPYADRRLTVGKEYIIELIQEAVYDGEACAKLIDLVDRPTVDCTKFMEWLKAEVLDEENWELNAVANGEIICRKFRTLGWLDVEDGYYVDTRPTVDKEHLIDLIQEAVYGGEACAKLIDLVDRPTGKWIVDIFDYKSVCSICGAKETNFIYGTEMWYGLGESKFCPNCGAYMKGNSNE